MNRRRFLGVAGAASLLGGCDLSFSDGIFNACHAEMPPHLRTHALVAAAWQGLDAREVWDVHCHVVGTGDSGKGIWINPAMERIWQPAQYLQRLFYMNAGCAHNSPGRVDASVVDRLLNQCEAMAPGFRVLLLAFDWARDETGAPVRERSTFYVPDAYAADLAARHPHAFEWAASIHPYAPDALDRLDAAKARSARAVKWLPSAQGIDPSSERCDRFYEKLKYLRLPLISHAGDERAVRGFGEHLGNPLLLRRPLEAGVRVVVAHCASLGMGRDLDRPDQPLVDNFALFARLMDEPQHRANLRGDISAVTQGNRMDVIDALLARRDWHPRLLNGSDYPLPGVLPVISLPGLAARKLLDPAAVAPLRELRDHNALLFDFVLKRSLARDGAGFAQPVFETRPYFLQSA
jgi:mannonate dehydratase